MRVTMRAHNWPHEYCSSAVADTVAAGPESLDHHDPYANPYADPHARPHDDPKKVFIRIEGAFSKGET